MTTKRKARFQDSNSVEGWGTLCCLYRWEDHDWGEYLGQVWLGNNELWTWEVEVDSGEVDEDARMGSEPTRRLAKKALRAALRELGEID
jgi:hypothetical protein